MSALSLASWAREMGESPTSEQQSGTLVIALKQRHQSSRYLLAQKAVSVCVPWHTNCIRPLFLLFHYVTE